MRNIVKHLHTAELTRERGSDRRTSLEREDLTRERENLTRERIRQEKERISLERKASDRRQNLTRERERERHLHRHDSTCNN